MELIEYKGTISAFQAMETEYNDIDDLLINTFSDNSKNSLIIDTGNVIGMISFSEKYESKHIEVLYILNKYRCKKLGKKLIDFIKNNTTGKITVCPFTTYSENFFLREGFKPEEGNIVDGYEYLSFNLK